MDIKQIKVKAIPVLKEAADLTHEYFYVDLNLVWEIIQKDIPLLKKQIKGLIIGSRLNFSYFKRL